MRLLHTSDWHLGRGLHGANLIEDQSHLLEQLVDLARQAKPDAVLIAGDVYDRGVPPTEAVRLLNDVLCRLVHQVGVPVLVIAGNHDSAERLSFGADLLRSGGLHIQGEPDDHVRAVVLQDEHGFVHLYPVPFAEPAVVRHRLRRPELQGHAEALGCLLDGIRARHPRGARSVVVGHCFVGGLEQCESERPLSVGGAGAVDPALLAGFDYVALGHLHRPQQCHDGRIRYSGSLMPYSFGEASDAKGVLVVEMDAAGACQVERVGLAPRRKVRCVSGTLAEVLAARQTDPARDDYLMVTLLDEGPVYDAMGRLREAYPNVLHIERAAVTPAMSGPQQRMDHRKTGDAELFAAFYAQVTDRQLDAPQRVAFVQVADAARRSERDGAQ